MKTTTPATVPTTLNPATFCAISSRFVGPTNTRGARVRVHSSHTLGARFFAWNYELRERENHAAAVGAYLAEIAAADKSGRGWGTLPLYCHGVLASGEHVFTLTRFP